MSYNKMAAVYDVFMDQAPYDDWYAFTLAMIKMYRPNRTERIVDLGCGTGQITCQLAQANFQMTGVDLATDMLSEAAVRANQANLSIQWLHQDLRELTGLSAYDVAISYCDVLNYLTNETDIGKAFLNTHQLLADDGLFIFDVHSLNHVEKNLKGQVFSEVYDDLAYIWFCEAGDNQGEVHHDLTFFVEDDQKYDRFDEQHHQRTFSIDVYQEMLQSAGFSVRGLYADFSTEPITAKQADQAERLFFVCQKD